MPEQFDGPDGNEKKYLAEIARLWQLLEKNKIPFSRPQWLADRIESLQNQNGKDSVLPDRAGPTPSFRQPDAPFSHSSAAKTVHGNAGGFSNTAQCGQPALANLEDPGPLPKVQDPSLALMEAKTKRAQAGTSQAINSELFESFFHGRPDRYLRQALNTRRFYLPCALRNTLQCQPTAPNATSSNLMCSRCKNSKPAPLTRQVLHEHLEISSQGRTTPIKIYPIQPDQSTWFLAFELRLDPEGRDLAALQKAVDTLERTVMKHNLPALKVLGAGGQSVSLWLFFRQPVPCRQAVEAGNLLVLRAILEEGLEGADLFAGMVPSHPPRSSQDPGNPIELPLQPEAMKEGTSLFVDKDWQPFSNPWQVLENTGKISGDQLRKLLDQGRRERLADLLLPALPKAKDQEDEDEEGRKSTFDYASLLFEQPDDNPAALHPSDIDGALHLIRGSRLCIRRDNLSLKAQGLLYLMAAFQNPEYQKRNTRFASGPPVISLAGFSADGQYLELPKGLLQPLLDQLADGDIPVEFEDRSQAGQRLEIEFNGKLREEQQEMVDTLAAHETGILEAATGTGKTVMAAALIAKKKVNTLVLVQSKEILSGWVRTLNQFLTFKDPEYEQPALRSRTYPGKIGVLQSQTNTLCQRVDVAMMPTLISRDEKEEILGRYGMVLVDECHHCASPTAQSLLNQVSARFLYGFSATPRRTDGLDPGIIWQIGPVVTRFTSRMQMAGQNFGRFLVPCKTRFIPDSQDGTDFMRIVQEAAADPLRNAQIVSDVLTAMLAGAKVLVLTRFVDHARLLAAWIEQADKKANLLVYAGDPVQKQENAKRLKQLDPDQKTVLVGTYSSIGEGFDYPPLDTLMLALPVRSQISISQAIGRIHRPCTGKTKVMVYDYIDQDSSMLAAMYQARAREYRLQGYSALDFSDGSREEKDDLLFPPGCDLNSLQAFEGSKAALALKKDLGQVTQRIALLAPHLEEQEIHEISRWCMMAAKNHPYGSLRIDLFVEKMDAGQVFALEQANIHVHVHERVIETAIVLDQQIIWYGPVWKTGAFFAFEQNPASQAGAAWLEQEPRQFSRMNSRLQASFVLEPRRQEEIRILKARKSQK